MRLHQFLLATLLARAPLAHADTFNLNADLGQGTGTLTGTLNIDTVKGLVTGADLRATLFGQTSVLTDVGPFQYAYLYIYSTDADWIVDVDGENGTEAQLHLDLPDNVFSLAGYTGGTIGDNFTSYFQPPVGEGEVLGITGTVTPAAPSSPVPEPSSLVLFGTGLLGLTATLRSRLRR